MEQSKHRRVILFPLPFPASHINPMLQLANILHTKGFSITIIHTNFNSHNFNPSAHPHFTFISIPDGLSESEAATNNILHLFSLLNVKCVEQFRECLASLLSADANSEEPIACLISDAIFHFTQPVAESLKLPRLALETMGATCTAVYYAFPLLRERGYLPIQGTTLQAISFLTLHITQFEKFMCSTLIVFQIDYRLEELVKELPPLKVKDLPVVKGCDADKYFEFIQTKNNLDSKMEQSKGRRLILCPLPLQGHINPMLELAKILHSKGFSIAIIHTNFNSLNPSTRNPHFTYHSIPVDLTETEASIKDLTVVLSILNAKCVEPFRECLAGLLSDGVHSGNPIACLISDPFFDFTRSVAESFELPTIMLRTGSAASLAVYAAFPLLKEKGYLPISDSRLEIPVAELSPLKVKDLPTMTNCDPEILKDMHLPQFAKNITPIFQFSH
ncbi:hypothetical protein DVH24_024226 [Malus domestica]|uniref:Uncharacterized protein n=1 Tax=Malus domestica TaxID=3750 RepID=A0A498JLR0_MALDO|nr:hypothetical protein DVH24_024226 [Malus domestica]